MFVKQKTEAFSDQAPLFALVGNQGNEWRVGHVNIPPLVEEFQVSDFACCIYHTRIHKK